MPQKQIELARRPQGIPVMDDFRIKETEIPEAKNGEALVKTLYVSVDPYEGECITPDSRFCTAFIDFDFSVLAFSCRIISIIRKSFFIKFSSDAVHIKAVGRMPDRLGNV